MRVQITPDLWAQIHRHLDDERERAAFLFMQPADESREVWVPESEWFLDPQTDYDHSSHGHVALAPHVLPTVFKRAQQTKSAVLEVHGHYWVGDRTRFSPYDILGLVQLVPQMLWRLADRPYFALVVGQESFDTLFWIDRNQAQTLALGLTDGTELLPTGLSVAEWERRDEIDLYE